MKKFALLFVLVPIIFCLVAFYYLDGVSICLKKVAKDPAALVSFLSMICTISWSAFDRWVISSWLQREKNEFSKDADKYKHELKVDFIKAEIRSQKLPGIYSELLTSFKLVEGVICGLCSEKQKLQIIDKQRIANIERLTLDALGFMIKNILFISHDIEKQCDGLAFLFHQSKDYLENDIKTCDEIKAYKKKVRDSVDVLMDMMRKETRPIQ